MLPDLIKLYKPYSEDADLKTSLLYWEKEANKLGISPEIRDSAIAETFLEMANGKEFPVGSCDCGCEFPVKWSCVALNHYVLKKMIAFKSEVDNRIAEILKDNIHAQMLALISKENQEYIAKTLKPDWKYRLLNLLGFKKVI